MVPGGIRDRASNGHRGIAPIAATNEVSRSLEGPLVRRRKHSQGW